MTLGERLLILRRRNHMTQKDLAKEAGLNTNTIARLEQGNLKDLGGQAVVRLAKALGTSTDYLLGMSAVDPDSEPEAALAL
jgi:transcriptional regulator with XRE-family HTH domain